MVKPSRTQQRPAWPWLAAATLLIYGASHYLSTAVPDTRGTAPAHAEIILARCAALRDVPVAPTERRLSSDRFVDGTKPYLIRNATIWTGEDNGRDVVRGDILIDQGLIQAIGKVPNSLLNGRPDLVVLEANSAWLTPGIVDMHSHMGDEPSPALHGATDGNSLHGPILPWLRSLDALNTHDESYRLSVAGGITTALVLPGSANAIGGEAYAIKIRPTAERTPTSMLVDGPPETNGTTGVPLRWRHMKHACGENPARVYGDTRMDSVWKMRQAYDKARQIKEAQDDYCGAAAHGRWDLIEGKTFPDELQWASLVAILRGRVKVQTHCYEATDITNFVRISNEFRFPIAAFHHAHEAYLVPSVLKSAYGGTPAIAQFGSFSRYKREAFRHSQYAPRLLADEGIPVVMKSDHPAISRSLLHEAQQAHYHGLSDHLALSSVTTVPAKATGLDWRLGAIRAGLDADVVLWDSHPLSLGATPLQVFIDGIPQLDEQPVVPKIGHSQHAPVSPNFDQEAQLTLKFDGLPPLDPSSHIKHTVVFTNVSNLFNIVDKKVVRAFGANEHDNSTSIVVVDAGRVVCNARSESKCSQYIERADLVTYVDLAGGSIGPGLVAAGTGLGLAEIAMESSTADGAVFDPLQNVVPAIVGGEQSIIRAVDGLMFGTRDSLLAYRSGVVASISSPANDGFLSGLSVAFSPGVLSALRKGAILQDVAAVHVTISMDSPISVSTQVAALRQLLSSSLHDHSHSHYGDRSSWFKQVTSGKIPLVISVHSADIMVTLIELKKEIEHESGENMKFVFAGAAEAHLLAEELADARVGVFVTPTRAFPGTWEQRRILAGPPLTSESGLTKLFRHNVSLAIGPQGLIGVPTGTAMSNWAVQNLRWDAGWAAIESNGVIKEEDALALASTNVADLLGLKADTDLVAVRGGGLMDFLGRVVAVISEQRGVVDIL